MIIKKTMLFIGAGWNGLAAIGISVIHPTHLGDCLAAAFFGAAVVLLWIGLSVKGSK